MVVADLQSQARADPPGLDLPHVTKFLLLLLLLYFILFFQMFFINLGTVINLVLYTVLMKMTFFSSSPVFAWANGKVNM